jgi:hypothetical protein
MSSFGCDLGGAIRSTLKMFQDQADFAVKQNKEKFGEPKKAETPKKEQEARTEKAKEQAFTPKETKASTEKLSLRDKELSLNFSIMQQTIAAGNGDQIDHAFLEIFANDIQEIEDKKEKDKLSSELQVLANRIYEAKEKVFFKEQPGQERPLMGEKISLKTLADTYTPGDVKKGLEKLDASFAMRPIKGDGHCLFRAIAASAVGTSGLSSEKEAKVGLRRLEKVVDSLESAELKAEFIKVREILLSVAKKKISFQEAMNAQKTSDELVSFLRKFACEYNKKHESEVFDSIVEASGKTKGEYLAEMSDMTKAKYATHAEIHALAQALGINIRVLHTVSIGKGEEAYPDHLLFNAHPGEEDLFVIHRPGHFDLGIKKPGVVLS